MDLKTSYWFFMLGFHSKSDVINRMQALSFVTILLFIEVVCSYLINCRYSSIPVVQPLLKFKREEKISGQSLNYMLQIFWLGWLLT